MLCLKEEAWKMSTNEDREAFLTLCDSFKENDPTSCHLLASHNQSPSGGFLLPATKAVDLLFSLDVYREKFIWHRLHG